MSHFIFSSDYFSLTWEVYHSSWDTSVLSDNHYFRLWVSILVNWKLKTFNLQFKIDKAEKFWLMGDYYTFVNWYEWDTFRKTIESLWYSFWEFSISKAIDELTSEQLIAVEVQN